MTAAFLYSHVVKKRGFSMAMLWRYLSVARESENLRGSGGIVKSHRTGKVDRNS